jgi:acyl-CoA thioesterase FadM
VFRTSTSVTPEDTRPLIADVDPTAPGYGNHLSFDRILRRCGLAWTEFLNALGSFDGGVICPHLSVDYVSEIGEGTLDVDVSVLSVGGSSFRVLCAVSQDGRPAARVEVVLVSFAYATREAVPLTDQQRSDLHAHHR